MIYDNQEGEGYDAQAIDQMIDIIFDYIDDNDIQSLDACVALLNCAHTLYNVYKMENADPREFDDLYKDFMTVIKSKEGVLH